MCSIKYFQGEHWTTASRGGGGGMGVRIGEREEYEIREGWDILIRTGIMKRE